MFTNPLASASKTYDSSFSNLASAFNSDWNDQVHDSYGLYVKFCEESSNYLNKTSRTLGAFIEELNKIDIYDLLEKAENLHKEIEGAIEK